MKNIIILGTGGNCIDILDMVNEINYIRPTYECLGFLDDNEELSGRTFQGVKVIGTLRDASSFTNCYFINGIGSTRNFWKKRDIIASTGIPEEYFITLIHPTASVSRFAEIDRGSVIFQNVSITSNVRVGKHVAVLPNSVISHDDWIGGYTCIAGSVCISGNVKIGESCYLGAGSNIRDGIRVGNNCLIGMGSNVLEDIVDNSMVFGNPARFYKKVLP